MYWDEELTLKTCLRALGLVFVTLLGAGCLRADEGMWTFDNLPLRKMKAKYAFVPDAGWANHLRLSAVRFPAGSGSFISKDGLVLTNHHVGHSWIESVSDPGHDYVKLGFVARSRAEERKVPGLELRTLVAMENVTPVLEQAVRPGATDAQAAQDRRATLARLLKEGKARTGLAFEPVILYQGGEVWLYVYQVHRDVRLVMAPEYAVAAFGKDWDNFSFPRHDLDFSLFRVYEKGLPYTPGHFLRWSSQGLKRGDMTFVVGHPGRTSRLETLAQMEAVREVLDPLRLRGLERSRRALHAFADQSPENARQVSAALMAQENAYKVYVNEVQGLRNPEAMARVAEAEKELQARVAKDPGLQALAGESWTLIQRAMALRCRNAKGLHFIHDCNSRLLGFALGLVRYQAEGARPAEQRLYEYRTAPERERQKAAQMLEAIDLEREKRTLAQGLQEALEELGPSHPFILAALGGRSPEGAAKALLEGTTLADPTVRAALADGPAQAILDSTDGLMVLARTIESLSRPLLQAEEDAQAVISEQGARIAKARFKVYGKTDYPDATFTLRLSYGSVETYPSNGTLAQPFTTFGGLFDRADGWGPEAEDHSWELPPRWQAARGALNSATPFNFITTNDIIGGNSGSPVVDRQGDLVGLVFDGNIESIPGRFFFEPRTNRAIALDGRAILEALAKVYDAAWLVQEITSR